MEQDFEYPPPATSHFSRPAIVCMALLALLLVMAVTTAFYGSQSYHSHVLSPLEKKQEASQFAAVVRSIQPPIQPPEDEWVESRDGDGALDIEDTNGPATIYFDNQSRTRFLCVQNTGCYHLRGHRKAIK